MEWLNCTTLSTLILFRLKRRFQLRKQKSQRKLKMLSQLRIKRIRIKLLQLRNRNLKRSNMKLNSKIRNEKLQFKLKSKLSISFLSKKLINIMKENAKWLMRIKTYKKQMLWKTNLNLWHILGKKIYKDSLNNMFKKMKFHLS